MGSKRTHRREQARRRQGVRSGIPLGLDDVPAYVEIKMELKCKKCGKKYEADEGFFRRKESKTGYQHECKKCRAEIKREAAQRKRAQGEKPKESMNNHKKERKKKERDIKTERRRKMLQAAGEKIAEGVLIAETPRSMTFTLALIVEQQLRMFYGRGVTSGFGQNRVNVILDTTLFEIKEALGRAGVRMKSVPRVDSVPQDLKVMFEQPNKEAAARRLLGVPEHASQEEIKRAYRQKATLVHPDHNGSVEGMQRLNEAYALLTEGSDGI